jgi:3-deoxy-manno-octulosonate cytidylyltransferase (CMP-KDO synthetase)
MSSATLAQTAIIIPARLASTRLPEKALALLDGKPLILHVWERCMCAGAARVIVATDHPRIGQVVQSAGGEVAYTDPSLPSGTDRCAKVSTSLKVPYIINVQGDEPFIESGIIHHLADLLGEGHAGIVTLAHPLTDQASLHSPHTVKVVTSLDGHALYFSRQAIPYVRDDKQSPDWLSVHPFLGHIGVYGFRRDTLLELARLKPGLLERTEQLEQLRWLENGYRIRVGVSPYQTMGIDTVADLQKAELRIASQSKSPEKP